MAEIEGQLVDISLLPQNPPSSHLEFISSIETRKAWLELKEAKRKLKEAKKKYKKTLKQ